VTSFAHFAETAPETAQYVAADGCMAACLCTATWHNSTIYCLKTCVRTFAQLVLHQLLEDFPEAVPGVANQMPSPWRECLKFFRTNPDMQRLEKSLAPALRSYTPHQAITPAGVFYSVRTSHIPHLYSIQKLCTELYKLPARLLFHDVAAAAFR